MLSQMTIESDPITKKQNAFTGDTDGIRTYEVCVRKLNGKQCALPTEPLVICDRRPIILSKYISN